MAFSLICLKSVKINKTKLSSSRPRKKRSCFILFDKLNKGEKVRQFSPVCTSPKLPPHSGPILDQIDLTRSQKPGIGLASQGFHCR